MNREIKFRGKSKFSNHWFYGHLLSSPGGVMIYGKSWWNEDNEDSFGVVENTVGQFTGLKDKNGVDIYEGDIVQQIAWMTQKPIKGNVYFNERGYWMALEISSYHTPESEYLYEIFKNGGEIIGNIHDNPELLTP